MSVTSPECGASPSCTGSLSVASMSPSSMAPASLAGGIFHRQTLPDWSQK